jgi:hypothetical protein
VVKEAVPSKTPLFCIICVVAIHCKQDLEDDAEGTPNRQLPLKVSILAKPLFQGFPSVFWSYMAMKSMFFEPKTWTFSLDGLELFQMAI